MSSAAGAPQTASGQTAASGNAAGQQAAVGQQPSEQTAATGAAAGTNAGSGAAVSLAGQAQTTNTTTQISAGAVGGGSGPLAVQNQNTTSVQESGAASAQSGVSVALEPTPGSAITTANSGSGSAIGVTAQNTTTHTALAVVQIEGANDAPVSLNSSSTTSVQDTGASVATTGQAWAVAPGGGTVPASLVGGPATSTSSSTAPVSATGLTTQNLIRTSTATGLTVAGGAGGSSSIALSPNQSVSLVSGGVGVASSAAAAASTQQPLVPVPDVRAISGSAVAQGLVAQNTVDTHANASVHVAGQNFAPIQIVIDAITNIFNFGAAGASTGNATTGGGGPAGQGGLATSGAAQATGAQVVNQVDLRSSASVVVNGDNHNPITLILNLSANLINWGLGLASSGNAQSAGDPSHAGSAASGAASANGLLVANLVEMWADASVDIEGDNYAPIRVEIDFTTNIQNAGGAVASSGDAQAGTWSGQTGGQSGSVGSVGAVGSVGTARAGSATAIAPLTAATFSSNQIAVANGSHPIVTPNLAGLLRGLPSSSAWNPLLDGLPVADGTPPVQAGLVSQTGDAVAVGMNSSIVQSNTQVAVCGDPGVNCLARNAASLSVSSRDLPTNPVNDSPGGAQAVSGAVYANATPTPPNSSNTSNTAPTAGAPSDDQAGALRGGVQQQGTTVFSHGGGSLRVDATQVSYWVPRAHGHIVLVDLWDQWPGRRLPPTPRPGLHTPGQRFVDANSELGWPGADELPIPAPVAEAEPSGAVGVSGVGTPGRRLAAAQRADTPLAEEADDLPPLAVVDVDPWDWPDLEALPLPLLARPASPVANEPAAELVVDTAVGLDAPSTDGPAQLPVQAAGLALGALLVGWAGGTRRGRALLKRLWPGGRLGGSSSVLGRLAIGLRLWIIDRNGN